MDLDTQGILDRCREAGGPYQLFRQSGFNGFVHRKWAALGFDPITICADLDTDKAHLIKDRRKIRAGIVDDVFVKCYFHRGVWTSFRRMFKLSRPERVLAGALRLREYEIPTPEVLVAVRQSRHLLPYRDYLVTRELSPLQIGCDKLEVEFAQGDPYRQFVSGSVALLVKMHAAGVEHGDLSLRNIFCRKSPVGVYSDWGVLDLDGCVVYGDEMPESRRRRELARLISSFLRGVRSKTPQLRLDTNSVIFDFARKYQELSGFNLAGSRLDERVGFLANRSRREKKRR